MISKFNTILIEVPASLLVEMAKLVLKSIGKYSRPRIAKKTKKGKTKDSHFLTSKRNVFPDYHSQDSMAL